MKILKNAKVEKACSKDIGRPSMQSCWLDTEIQKLIATDGRILVAFPVEIEDGDDSGPVDPKALAYARKSTPKGASYMSIKCNGCYAFPDGSTMPRNKEYGQFPDWKFIFKNTESATKEPVGKIGINAEFLATIQEATDSFGVELHFVNENKPVIVKCKSSHPDRDQIQALIMPLT